jgi:hypothetical protein
MLMPAAVLIVIVLGALAIDRAVIFGAQRDLVATAQAAANDGAGAVDLDALRGGAVEFDEARIDSIVAAAAARSDGAVARNWEVQGDVLVVRLERRVELVFAGGVPGASGTQVVRATARSVLVRQ